MSLDLIGFGSLNLDEFWEVPNDFLESYGLRAGHEYIREVDWFSEVYPVLSRFGALKAIDPGGSAANMTAAMKKMGFLTGFFGAVGTDGIEKLRIEELGHQSNLALDVFDGPTGRCLCLINSQDENRDRCLVILPNANDLAGSRDIDEKYFKNTKWVHMTSFVSQLPLQAQKRALSKMGATTRLSFDPGAVYSRLGIDELKPLLERSSVLFVTEEELAQLTGHNDQETALNVLLAIGVMMVVTKKGSKGLMVTTADGTFSQDAIRPAEIVDRTGAGDVAAAGFIAGLLSGMDLGKCLELAARTASKSIEGYGRSAYPDRKFLRSFFQHQYPNFMQ